MSSTKVQHQATSWLGFAAETQLQVKSPHDQSQYLHALHIEVPDPGSRKKLRESCNSCALSKVRCSKDRPVCVRCEEGGKFCQYSLSRRTGARGPSSSSSSSVGTEPTVTPGLTTGTGEVKSFDFQSPARNQGLKRERENDPFEQLEYSIASKRISPQHPDRPVVKKFCPDIAATPTFDNNLLPWDNNIFSASLEGSMLDSSKFNTSVGTPAGFTSSSYLDMDIADHWNNISVATNYGEPVSLFSIMESNMKTSIPMKITTSPSSQYYQYDKSPNNTLEPGPVEPLPHHLHVDSQDCTMLALRTLQSLHLPASTCHAVQSKPGPARILSASLSPSSTSTTTINHIITSNRTTMGSIATILICPCSFDIHLRFILTLIVSEITTSYISVARSMNDIWISARKNTSAEHRCDDKRKIWAQLLLSELRRVLRLIDQLSKRFGDSAYNGIRVEVATSAGCACPPGTTSMTGQLEAFLRERVRAVTKETMDILRER